MPYDCILGYKVSSVDNLLEGVIHHSVKNGPSAKFLTKGSLEKGKAVIDTWMDIWKANL